MVLNDEIMAIIVLKRKYYGKFRYDVRRIFVVAKTAAFLPFDCPYGFLRRFFNVAYLRRDIQAHTLGGKIGVYYIRFFVLSAHFKQNRRRRGKSEN